MISDEGNRLKEKETLISPRFTLMYPLPFALSSLQDTALHFIYLSLQN